MKLGVAQLANYSFSVLRVIFLLALALFLPRMFSLINGNNEEIVQSQPNFKLGLESLSDALVARFSGSNFKKMGLITDQTGTTQTGKAAVDVLIEKNLPLTKIFFLDSFSHRNFLENTAPRYPDLKAVYRHEGAVSSSDVKDLDVIFFDVQDSGTSAHNYIQLLSELLVCAAQENKMIVVLDRPNLLGANIEGTFYAYSQQRSTLLPVRHGMTIGEIARLINTNFLTKQAHLLVVPMENYHRALDVLAPEYLDAIKSINSWYATTFLFPFNYIAPFETGCGACKMQCILLPENTKFARAKWIELRMLLKEMGVESSFHRSYNKEKGYFVCGLRLFVKNIENFSSINALIAMLTFFKQAGVPLMFDQRFDQYMGTAKLRGFILGLNTWQELEQDINKQLKLFFNIASHILLYKPVPRVSMV